MCKPSCFAVSDVRQSQLILRFSYLRDPYVDSTSFNQVRYLGSLGRRGMHCVTNAKHISNFTNWISMKTPSEPT